MKLPNLKEVFESESKYGAFYTGGNVEWHDDLFFCQGNSNISLVNINSGLVNSTVGDEEDLDTILTFTCENENIITAHRSGLLKLWDRNGQLKKTWKSIHKAPISKLCLHKETLASGGADSSICIWNIEQQVCILKLKGAQGVVNVVEFMIEKNFIFGSGDDGKIHMWKLDKGQLVRSFYGHLNKVTSLAFHYGLKYFISGGRDKVIILWNIESDKYVHIIPIYEAIESVAILPCKFELPGLSINDNDDIHVATAGSNGIISIWNITKSRQIYTQNIQILEKQKDVDSLSITKLIFRSNPNKLAVVTAQQNILLFTLKDFDCFKQLVGFSDEILDISYVGENDEFLAVVTNSCDIKLYNNMDMNCQLLKWHTDIVLSVNKCLVKKNIFASSAKDNSICLWKIRDKTAILLSVTKAHLASVNSIAFSNLSVSFLVSVSSDKCIKMWKLSDSIDLEALSCIQTQISHEKDVNCVTVSPNDLIIATASQDKTAKLWSNSLKLLGTLRGHKRGVNWICFSPVGQIVLTSSADCNVKLWSTDDLHCIKTIEAHDASVLRTIFFSNGTQILTAGADGLLKIFNVKTSECSQILDQHNARIWALALKSDESYFVSGGADSLLIKWKDVTLIHHDQKKNQENELMLQEQQMTNYKNSGNYMEALRCALKLNRPNNALKIIKILIKENNENFSKFIEQLESDKKELLLNFALQWNTNGKHFHEAQSILSVLLYDLKCNKFSISTVENIAKNSVPYSEKHFRRLTQLLQQFYFIEYSIRCIDSCSTGISENVKK